MPSHVVDCDHKHEEPEDVESAEEHSHRPAAQNKGEPRTSGITSESTPLLLSAVSNAQNT